MNHHFAGFLQLCDDTVQAVAAFANAKVPFDFAPFPGFLPFQLLLLLLDCRIGIGLAEFGSVKVDSTFLAVLHVLPSPENRICNDIITQNEDGSYTITVTNTPGVELPATGGPGTTLYYLLGSLLIMLASAGFILHSRKKKACGQ